MATLGMVTVRTLPVGGTVATTAIPTPNGLWLLGRRHIVLLIHGYNVSFEQAIESYNRLFTEQLPVDVGYFLWPGDARGGSLISSGSYPFQIRSAQQSAARLAEFLRGLFGPGGGPMTISLIGHSLGCRLALELLKLVAASTGHPQFSVVALMAAAVPVALVDRGGDLEIAARTAGKLALLYSGADDVLRFAFPEGQSAARLVGLDLGGLFAGANYDRAVGRYGEPTILTTLHADMTAYDYGHGDYWGPKREALDFVAPLFGIAVPRVMAIRAISTRKLPATSMTSSRMVSSALRTRGLPTRRLSRAG